MKLLSEIGASVEVLGAFAARYPDKVLNALGAAAQPAFVAPMASRDAAPGGQDPSPVDLEAVVHSMMTKVIQESGLLHKTASQKPGRVTVNVLCAGRRTSVKVQSSLVDRMNAVTGSAEESQRIIKQIAGAAPADAENRSGYVNEQIKNYLLLSAADQGGASNRH